MRQHTLTSLLLVSVLVIGSRLSPHFLEWNYLRDSLTTVAELGVVAIAMNYVIAAGQIDLSVGSNMVLTGCLTAKMLQAGAPPLVAIVVGIMIATLLGWLNGYLVTYFRAPAFLVTVGTLAVFRGTAKAMLGPTSAKIPESMIGVDTSTFAGLTVPLFILVILGVLATFVLHRTVFGQWVLAVGSNSRTALYSGVPVDRVIRSTFLFAGLFSGIGGLLMMSRLGLARPDLAVGAELDVITMVVVGGTLIQGGYASILGTLLAFLLIGLLRSTMGIASLTAELQLTAIGALLIVVVLAKRIRIQIPSRKQLS